MYLLYYVLLSFQLMNKELLQQLQILKQVTNTLTFDTYYLFILIFLTNFKKRNNFVFVVGVVAEIVAGVVGVVGVVAGVVEVVGDDDGALIQNLS